MNTRELLHNLEALFYGHLMEYENLSGNSEESIKSFEKLFNIVLPDDFKEYYTLKDGSGNFHLLHIIIHRVSYTTFSLMSLREMKKTKVYFCDRDESMEETYNTYEKRDKRIKPYLSNKKWFPFAQAANMSMYLMFDYDPAESGTMGQIICYTCEPRYIYYVGSSFSNLLEESIECQKIVRSQKKR
jgi:cell wall assembly regulator SMI1